MPTSPAGARRHLASSPFNAAREAAAAPVEPIEPGDLVCHERHGLGRAIRMDGDRAALVDFSGDMRRVELDSPRLDRL